MAKNKLKPIFILAVLLGALAFFYLRQSSASAARFSGVMPFTTALGLVGFFDQNDGKIYFYNEDLQKCISVSQVGTLGEPVKIIKKSY